MLGAASGAIAGLVAITPAAGFVGPLAAIAFGVGAGLLCYKAVNLKFRLGLDDSLDVIGVHLVGGLVGSLLLGVLAQASINGVDGLMFGNVRLLWVQLVAVIAVSAFSFIATWLIAKFVDRTVGLRVDPEAEGVGLDISLHGEVARTFETA